MSTAAVAPVTHAHGELDCIDAESILQETTHENVELRARLSAAADQQESLTHETEMLRLENERLRALLDDVARKNSTLVQERDDARTQVKFLHEELAAAEADAMPQDTLLFAPISRQYMVEEYRRASRINRGPLPPVVVAAIEGARSDIVAAMTQAGQDALQSVIRREVRRRRRAQSRR